MTKNVNHKRISITWSVTSSWEYNLANNLDAESYFINSINIKKNVFTLLKYIINTFITLKLLIKKKPDVIIIKNPPVFAVLIVWIYCIFRNCTYIVDTHSATFTIKYWAMFLWLSRFLSKRALMNILHNKPLELKVANWGAPALNIGGVIYHIESKETYPIRKGFNVVFVSVFRKDEPLDAIIRAARKLPYVNFYITGSLARAPHDVINEAPDNVIFTDFLPYGKYYALLKDSDIIISLTKNDNTMQNGAYEALTLERPIITSNWPVLQNMYNKGAICIDNTSDGIVSAINRIKRDYSQYLVEIKELKVELHSCWQENMSKLLILLNNWSKRKH